MGPLDAAGPKREGSAKAPLTGDEGYVKDTYSASLGAGENRWCYDSRASLQRLFSTNVHLGGQLAVTSASAC